MSAFWGQLFRTVAGLAAIGMVGPATVLAEDAPAPRYTYFGAGYESADTKCAVSPSSQSGSGLAPTDSSNNEGMSGYTAEGSVGLFSLGALNSVHLIGAYFDGDTDNSNVDIKCVELGAGVSYNFTPGADIVLRGYWVHADSDNFSGSADGFEPELQLRFAASDRAEINVGLAYYDMEKDSADFDSTETRIALIYNVKPWLGLRIGGVIFDDEAAFQAGVRGYFGGNLF